jgi:sulfatase modifying factor 1
MRMLLSLSTLSLAAATACAQPVPDYGFEWHTIGAPGNAPLMPGPGYNLDRPIGRVDYEFRMASTEVTTAQYLEFLVALTTAIPTTVVDISLTGFDIRRVNLPGGYEWRITGEENSGARIGFNAAAMYCNWLHNDKGTQPQSFLSGAYDVNTLYPNPNPGPVFHSPGARFWIPSRDEWTKAMYYDPHKHGQGQPGYWMYPITSDTPPVGGAPGTPGAQTGAGFYEPLAFRDWPVGSYPNAQSPWGILDGSGGVEEWCEGSESNEFFETRGTSNSASNPDWHDRVDGLLWNEFRAPYPGIRLVGVVPSPTTTALLCTAALVSLSRRRRAADGTDLPCH